MRGSMTITPWRAFRADPADWFSPDEVARAKQYARGARTISALSRGASVAAMVALVSSKWVPDLLDVSWPWPARLFVAIVVVQAIEMIITLPFSAYRELAYDKRWEFSNQTTGGFLLDLAKGIPLGMVILSVLFIPLWAVIRATDLWWLWGWVLFAGFTVLFNVLFPVLIAPIFNKYTPLEDGELRTALLDIARRVDADVSEILVEDASRRDARQNAYVAGLGRTRRVVVYDTMLGWPSPEIASVVAHEIGHWKLAHLRRFIPVAVVAALANFVVLRAVMSWSTALDWAGVDSVRDPAAFPLFYLVFPIGFTVTRLATSWLSRVHERQADIFALETTGDPDTFVAMMRRLHTDNLADLAPSWWRRVSHTHPPAAERLAMGSAWRDIGR